MFWKTIRALRTADEAKGVKARLRGWPQSCNPFRRNTAGNAARFEAWLRGWLAQRKVSLGKA
jgi:type IV secretory pathway VirB4 component